MFKIGYRTIKTAVGCGVAIFIAQALGLASPISAGILTILCIKPTKKTSFYNAWQRFGACVLGLGFAVLFFEVLGYHPLTIIVLLLVFIPTVVNMKAKEGVITSSVIILHVYTVDKLTWGFIWNEIVVIIIGIGVALILNSYMPSLEKELISHRKKIDENFAAILKEFARFLKEGKSDWEGKEIIETADILKEAKRLALKDIENHLLREADSYYTYFKMREKQFEILERLMPLLSSLDETYEEGRQIGDFLERLSEHASPKNTAGEFLEVLRELQEEFRESPLPKNRKEFEIRSALHHFINEMESYLRLKRDLKQTL